MIITHCFHFKHNPNINNMQIIFFSNEDKNKEQLEEIEVQKERDN